MKAGLMEIADVFVVNKSDRPGADLVVQEIRALLQGRPLPQSNGWVPPIVKTVAATDQGIAELHAAIAGHREFLTRTGQLAQRRTERWKQRLREMVEWKIQRRLWERPGRLDRLSRLAEDVRDGRTTLIEAAEALTHPI